MSMGKQDKHKCAIMPRKRHEVKVSYKFLEDTSLESLERQVNSFVANREVKDVKLTSGSFSEDGKMLGDRINKYGGQTVFYMANIEYMRDITAEKVEHELEQYVYKKIENMGNGLFDIRMGRTYTREELLNRIVSTDEFAELKRQLEEKYSIV